MTAEFTKVADSLYMIDASYHGRRNILSTYVVRGKDVAVVDPGPMVSIEGVMGGLKDLGVSPRDVKYVMATHIHLDHAGGSWKLLEYCPNARLYTHPRGVSHMVDPSRLVEAARKLFGDRVADYSEVRGVNEARVLGSEDNQRIDLGEGVTLMTVWTPGHAPHHQSYYDVKDKAVLLGDAGGTYNKQLKILLPTSPPPFNPEAATQSLERLILLHPKLACYGHFGYEENAVGMLKMHRDQLELWVDTISQGLKEGLNTSKIYQRLRLVDPMLSEFTTLNEGPRDSEERSPGINLRGFTEYFEWLSKKEKD